MDRVSSRAPNIYRPTHAPDADRPPGFASKRARIGQTLGTKHVGLSEFDVPPGEAAYPYHWHHADEELVIVLDGQPTLRTPEGERQLEPGEVVHFPTGPDGAHQLRNDTEQPVRFLSVSNKGHIDIPVYPDSGRIGIAERTPRGDGLTLFFPRDAAVDYWHNEPPPSSSDGAAT